ncbi:hypothetical protein NKG94_39180 [Micromonospora sp. M12]
MLEAFVAATESGELDPLLQVLAPDVVFVGDSGGHFPRPAGRCWARTPWVV